MSNEDKVPFKRSQSCYLFNEKGFFGGTPPQKVVTLHFIENREKVGYDTFPVLDSKNGFYEFFPWDDPEALKVIEPAKKGIYIENPVLFQDDEELSEEERALVQDAEELMQYHAQQEETSFFTLSKEDFSDAVGSFKALIHNPFTTDNFINQMNQTLEAFFVDYSEMPVSSETRTNFQTDIATTNLQFLTKPSSNELKVISEESINLSKQIADTLLPDQKTKYKISFVDFLATSREDARELIYGNKALSNALTLSKGQHIIDCDVDDMRKFIHYHYASVEDKIDLFFDYTKKRKIYEEGDTHDKLRRGFSRSRFLSYEAYKEYNSRFSDIQSPTSPSYQPRSPENDLFFQSNDEPPDRILTRDDYLQILVALTSFLFFLYGSDFSPSFEFCKIFFPSFSRARLKEGEASKLVNDFFRRFRLKYRCVFFSDSYKKNIDRAINDVLDRFFDKCKTEFHSVIIKQELDVHSVVVSEDQEHDFVVVDSNK